MFAREIQVPQSEPIQIPIIVTKPVTGTNSVEVNFYTGERIGTGVPSGLAKKCYSHKYRYKYRPIHSVCR